MVVKFAVHGDAAMYRCLNKIFFDLIPLAIESSPPCRVSLYYPTFNDFFNELIN
jgi:hypothetical protein